MIDGCWINKRRVAYSIYLPILIEWKGRGCKEGNGRRIFDTMARLYCSVL